VPTLLAGLTLAGFCNFQVHMIEQSYGIKNADASNVINSVQMLNRYTISEFEEI